MSLGAIDKGRELVTRFSTDLTNTNAAAAAPVVYTDDSGLEYQKRVANFSYYEDDPVAGNYYPITTGAYIADSSSRDVMAALCCSDPYRRLGCLKGGAGDVKRHPWFAPTDWGALLSKQVQAPWVPPMRTTDDVSNFPQGEQMLAAEGSPGARPYP